MRLNQLEVGTQTNKFFEIRKKMVYKNFCEIYVHLFKEKIHLYAPVTYSISFVPSSSGVIYM